jgi:STE24 endopeptidase
MSSSSLKRVRIACLPALIFASLAGSSAWAAQPPQISDTAQVQAATAPVTHYTLPPEKYRQAVALAHTGHVVYFADFAWSLLVLLFILRAGLAAKFRDWALRFNSRCALQALIFCPLVILTIDVASLPIHIWWHTLMRAYGLSVQGWASWLADWAKAELVTMAIFALAGWLLYEAIHRRPRRWWIGAWVAAVLLTIAGVYAEPLVFEPMFYDFQPLAKMHPQLSWGVEKIDARVGVAIPQDRILEMFASRKVNELNAYVSGIGSAKRVVFWDTLIARMDEPECLAVYGHELGHYVLNHVWKGIALSALGLAIALPLLAWLFQLTINRFGARWNIRDSQDWAALAAMLLLIMILQFVSTPLQNAISRYIEHQADVFGLEVTHGIVPDGPQVAANSFQILGETNLEEPEPSRPVVFWFYTHPPISDRIDFALHYDPWSPGRSPEFVH